MSVQKEKIMTTKKFNLKITGFIFRSLHTDYSYTIYLTLIKILKVMISLEPTSCPTIYRTLYSVILKSRGTSLSNITLYPPTI